MPPVLDRRRALELAALYPPTRALTADEAEAFACVCGRPYTVLTEHLAAACLTDGCARLGVLVNITDAAEAYAAAHGDPNPPGRARRRLEGLPVPWLTPVIGRLVFWRFVHGTRLARAQNDWLCQVCGCELEPQACAVTDPVGRLLTAAAAHQRCARQAASLCPVLSTSSVRLCPFTAADVTGLPAAISPDDPDAEAHRAPLLDLPAPSREWEIDPWAVFR